MMNEVQEWEELSREEVFRKYGRGIERVVFRLPEGKETDFYLYARPQSIACVALTEGNEVILVKQFRPGSKRVLLELPGGSAEAGEDLTAAMERELLEETGYRGKVEFVTSVFPDAYSTNRKNAFVAVGCKKISEPKLEDNGEAVAVELMTFDEFREHIRTGQMTDVEISYLCLDHLGLL